jgi:hypothetical protein
LVTVGLALGAAGLTVANVIQLGTDPITDTAEVADVGALAENVSEDSSTAPEDGATGDDDGGLLRHYTTQKAADSISKLGNILQEAAERSGSLPISTLMELQLRSNSRSAGRPKATSNSRLVAC